MKIQVMSDLHIEFRRDQKRLNGVRDDIDLLVLAGDIAAYPALPRLWNMLDCQKEHWSQVGCNAKVLCIPGNHEFYGAPNVDAALGAIKTGLEDDSTGWLMGGYLGYSKTSYTSIKQELQSGPRNVRLIYATLWSDLSNPIDRLYGGALNDFRVPGLTLDWYIEQHRLHREYLESQLRDAYACNEVAVVVTHHCPSHLSTPERFKNSPLTPCFSSDLSNLMYGDYAPALWIHGHTHDSFDYVLGNTRVVCNPKGYPGEEGYKESGYIEELIVEI